MFKEVRDKKFVMTGLLGALLIIAAGFSGCDTAKLNDALDNFDVVIGLDPINTSASGQFVDARTGELIEKPITVAFKGENGDAVIDMYSKPLDQQEVDGGLISFGLNNDLKPSKSNPASVSIVANAEGYVSTGQTVTFKSEGQTNFVVHMVDENNPPEGSKVQSENQGEAGSDGAVQQDISVSSGTESQSNSSTSLDVKKGTVLKDSDGNQLSGRLKTTIGYYNNRSDKSMKSFPGTFSSSDGNNLVTAGFSSIDIQDAEGRKAKTFSKDVQLRTEIPADMTNPNTGKQLQTGDKISIYSYDTEQTEWKQEGEATLKGPNANGNYYVEYSASHLSFWGTFFPNVPTCTEGASATINRNGNTGPLQAVISAQGFSQQIEIPAGVNTINIPEDLPISSVPAITGTLKITVPGGEVTQTGNLCSGNYTINLPPPPADLVDVNVNAQLQCPSPDEAVRVTDIPTATVRYRSSEPGENENWKAVSDLEWNFNEDTQSLEGGSFVVQGVVDGSAYDFKIFYDGDTYSRKGITLNAPSTSYTEEVSNDVCN